MTKNKNNKGMSFNAMASISEETKNIVLSLKEIVNCTEIEIFHVLQDCNMDPHEAADRLLNQDPFHEVKSKREKKKGKKDGADHSARTADNFPNRGFRNVAEHFPGHAGSTQIKPNGSSALHSKPIYKKENGTQAYSTTLSSAHDIAGNNLKQNRPSHSEYLTTENKMSVTRIGCSTSLAQSAWSGASGQVTMADIVKMDRPQGKVSGMPNQPQDNIPKNSSALTTHNVHLQDEWPQIEQSLTVSVSPVLKLAAEPESNSDQKMQLPVKEDFFVRNLRSDHCGSTTGTSEDIEDNSSGEPSHFDNISSSENLGSYSSDRHTLEHSKAEERATSVAEYLQQLNLETKVKEEASEEGKPQLIIPDHLKVHTPKCPQLTFGSFIPFSRHLVSMPSKDNPNASRSDSAPVGHADIRNTENYEEDNIRAESSINQSGQNDERYDTNSGSHLEALTQDAIKTAHGNPYGFPSYTSGYNYDNYQQLDAILSQPQTSSQMQNIPYISAAMREYASSLPSTLLPSSVQTVRETDLSRSPFAITHSIPTKYNDLGSISGSSISMVEAMRGAQQAQQNIYGANIATGPTLPRQLAVPPYSRPIPPLGIDNPFLPQQNTCMLSAFHQARVDKSAYNRSLAALLPQYEYSISAASFPQPGAVASGYEFGTSASIPGQNFSAPAGTTIGFDDVLLSQYKQSSRVIPAQQNENSTLRGRRPGSRTMSGVPTNSYYGFPRQIQNQTGYRQSQQPSQQFAALGYPNLYQSQSPISLEQLQNPGEGSLFGSHDQVSPSQQTWQNWR